MTHELRRRCQISAGRVLARFLGALLRRPRSRRGRRRLWRRIHRRLLVRQAETPPGQFILAPTTVSAGPCSFDYTTAAAGSPGFEFQEFLGVF
jgi:hypothetical protein